LTWRELGNLETSVACFDRALALAPDRFHLQVRRVGAFLIPFAERRVSGASDPWVKG
jgi:hypothetical protein